MGLYDRDYYRDDPRPSGGWVATGAVCRKIVLVTVGVFILQMLTQRGRGADSWVGSWLEFDLVSCFARGQIWRLITYAFVHSPLDLWHIVGNMLFLWFFGPAIEAIYGPREFVRFYLTSAVVAALCWVLLSVVFFPVPPAVPTAENSTLALAGQPLFGASGAVMAVLMLYAVHYPRHKVYVMGIIPVEVRWLVGLFVLFDTYPVWQQLMGRGREEDFVAHAAHLGGLLYGFLFWKLDLRHTVWDRIDNLFSWSEFTKKRRQQAMLRKGQIRVHRPEPESDASPMDRGPDDSAEFSDRVDEVLKKISLQGEASLSAAERALLVEAAERYKRRKGNP
ncbi:MAG: rhomboid family intramembrane serine protease [Planctomycetota bacterium]|nr:rhomboid family intramembrane serine protease [Planctomycetota bacterium]